MSVIQTCEPLIIFESCIYMCDAYTHAVYDYPYAYASSNSGRHVVFAKSFLTICETCRKLVYIYI